MPSELTRPEAPSLALLHSRRSAILDAAERFGASNMCVFGSVARDEAGPDSDIDVLVDLDEGRSLIDLAGLRLELEDLLRFPVELSTDIKPRLRKRVHAEVVSL